MKRAFRLIMYEGPEEWINNTLTKSLQGQHPIGSDRSIRAFELPPDQAPEEILNLFENLPLDDRWQLWFPSERER